MCHNETKFVEKELYMKCFLGNRLKNPNSALNLKITLPKNKFEVRGWHQESLLKI